MRRPQQSFLRRPVRRAVDLPCQVVRMRDFRLVADRLVNVSLDGLLAQPADAVLTGEPVLVSFEAPFGGLWIDIEGVITRVAHGRRPGEWTRGLGIELSPTSHTVRDALRLRLACLPPTPPRLRPGRRARPSVLRNLVRRTSVPSLAGSTWATPA